MNPRFALGDKVRIDCSWSEANHSLGTIAQPPENVRQATSGWREYCRGERNWIGKASIIYWVNMDKPTTEPGDIDGGEFDEDNLQIVE